MQYVEQQNGGIHWRRELIIHFETRRHRRSSAIRWLSAAITLRRMKQRAAYVDE
jgi:hypothetical protein